MRSWWVNGIDFKVANGGQVVICDFLWLEQTCHSHTLILFRFQEASLPYFPQKYYGWVGNEIFYLGLENCGICFTLRERNTWYNVKEESLFALSFRWVQFMVGWPQGQNSIVKRYGAQEATQPMTSGRQSKKGVYKHKMPTATCPFSRLTPAELWWSPIIPVIFKKLYV